MALFEKRHYEWLARFAGQHLTDEQSHKLASALYRDNSNCDVPKFIRACDRCREFAHKPAESVFTP
jgi:hypothetical protein